MAINLDKVKFVLDKRQINDIPCNVVFGMDVSGSTKHLYAPKGTDNSVIQQVTERIFAISMSVDVDKSLDFVAFDSDSYELPSVTESNVSSYIQKNIANNARYWGGTNYGPMIKTICDNVATTKTKRNGFFSGLFKKKDTIEQPDIPVLAIVITDGANDDRSATERLLIESQSLNIYWQLVGIGDNSKLFVFLEQMADKYPNVGYIPINDIKTISDEDLYDGLLNDEFADWIKQFK